MRIFLISYVAFVLAFGIHAAEHPPLFDPNGLSLIIGGNGNITTTGPAVSIFGANVALVQKGTLGLPFQIGVRQTFQHQRVEDEDSHENTFSTRLFYDAIFLKLTQRLDFGVGANVGIFYGNTTLQWQAGPEFGLRWWFKPNVALIGRVDYPFDLNRGRAAGILNYFIGVQVNLEK